MCGCSGLQAENSFYPDLYTHLFVNSTYVPGFLHDSHLEFLSLFPVLVRALQGQLSSRLRAVWCCSASAGDAEVGGRLPAGLGVTSAPTLLGELISRWRETNNLLAGETGV